MAQSDTLLSHHTLSPGRICEDGREGWPTPAASNPALTVPNFKRVTPLIYTSITRDIVFKSTALARAFALSSAVKFIYA
ncbi:MAG: hypothetical protein KAR65_09090 [Anaerolineales bacterium]|nr:hypothetical protein [Anaerolineales bacterium]MCK5634297.1 hypothetical protein [Anaerolineales bacterium]